MVLCLFFFVSCLSLYSLLCVSLFFFVLRLTSIYTESFAISSRLFLLRCFCDNEGSHCEGAGPLGRENVRQVRPLSSSMGWFVYMHSSVVHCYNVITKCYQGTVVLQKLAVCTSNSNILWLLYF